MAEQKIGKTLVIAADSTERQGRAFAIEMAGYSCATAASLPEAVRLLGSNSFDLVVTEPALEGFEPGQIVKSLKKACPSVVVMALYHPANAGAVLPADISLAIPCSPKKFHNSIRRALSKKGSRMLPRRDFERAPFGSKSGGTGQAKAAASSSLRSRL